LDKAFKRRRIKIAKISDLPRNVFTVDAILNMKGKI